MTTNFDRPIGYWLKRADEVITRQMGAALSSEGVSRFHWQLLNLLRGPERTVRVLARAMENFVDAAGVDRLLAELTERGWVSRSGDEFEVTAEGEAAYARLAERIGEFRRRSREGISDEEYATVVRTLQRMIENLERP